MALSESGTYPETFAQSRGKTLFRWNIQEKQVTDPMTGEACTVYVYNEVAIRGKVTQAKILEAMRLADLGAGGEGDAATQYEDANAKIAEIADMTYEELKTYINNNVTDLASTKMFLKKLAKVVLAILKRFSW